MKLVINLVLALAVVLLAGFLIKDINEPIEFKAQKDQREAAVVDQLKEIRKAQLAYRGITGEYAPTFDTLRQVLTTDSFQIVKIFGNPDDDNAEIKKEIAYVLAKDSITRMGLVLEDIEKVPFGEGKTFQMEAMVIDYKSTKVPVVEVKTPIRDYMGKYAEPRYMRYDNKFDPNLARKFGDLTKPSTAGNWE